MAFGAVLIGCGPTESPRRWTPTPEALATSRSVIAEMESVKFIMKREGDDVYVDREWYQLPFDKKKNFVVALDIVAEGRTVHVLDGYSGKKLATAYEYAVDVEAE